MGGWRCSYRNCTIRSDGKTHMFHYPVFDKVRCRQWLVNAARLDFLNLKVSQLKNRVVCQHHFSDEQFMNFKRDKLTFDAVPTFDGLFCDTSEGESKKHEETTNSLSIILDDIENEYMSLNDKIANYSVKYADFLTSNDLADIDISNYIPQNNVFNRNKFGETEPPAVRNNNSTCEIFTHTVLPTETYTEATKPEINKKYKTQPVLVVPPYDNKLKQNQSQIEENVLEIQLPPGFINNNALITDTKVKDEVSGNATDKTAESITPTIQKKPAKVKILSEKRISGPLNLTGNLEPVSPSTILHIPRRPPRAKPQDMSNDIICSSNQQLLLNTTLDPVSVKVEKPLLEPVPMKDNNNSHIPLEPVKKKLEGKEKIFKECEVKQNKNIKSPKKSLLKNKITPERVAAINEKRRFNMKLRDIIETFLDKLDEQDKEVKDANSALDQRQEVTCLTSKSKSPTVADHTIASLEARIKKMEDSLLNKIDQNSQRILDLKNTIVRQKPKQKCSSTQTSTEVETQKKQLYQEISQFLSPTANSLIYEELFINKYVEDVPKVSSAKRRRR